MVINQSVLCGDYSWISFYITRTQSVFFFFHAHFIIFRVEGEPELIPAAFKRDAESTLHRSPVHHRTNTKINEKNNHARSHSFQGVSLESPNNLPCRFSPPRENPSTHKRNMQTPHKKERFKPGTFLLWENSANHSTIMQTTIHSDGYQK